MSAARGIVVASTATAAAMAFFAFQSSQPTLVRAQSDAGQKEKKKTMIRRHSSGDHAFLPSKQDRDAKKASQKNFGVPDSLPQDSEGSRLPTTRGY